MNYLKGTPCVVVLLFHFTSLWNEVAAMCPVKCNCDDENLRVECDSANLEVVPLTLNPELRELVLKNNNIKGIMASLTVYHNLEYLDVSQNQLITIDKNNFQKQNQLKYLFLSKNMLSSLHNETFSGLEKLIVLHINDNLLEEVSPNVFSVLSKLEILDISQNRIFFISESTFFGLDRLRVLSLRNNKLTDIPTHSFHNLLTLIKLDIGLNSFRTIPEEAFSSLTHLKELSIDGNGIQIIKLGAFRWLNSLLVLRLQDNELSEVPTNTFYDVRRLEEINIGQNKFIELKPFCFKRLKYLRVIEISGCEEMVRIQNGAFEDNRNLEKLVLNHNKIFNQIERQAFKGLSKLRLLSLRGNAFTTFHHDWLPWDKLDVLDVRDNPLVCNCELMWLWKLLKKYNVSSLATNDLTEVQCSSPLFLENSFLKEASEEELGCYLENRRRNLIIGVMVATVMVICVLLLFGFRYRKNISRAFKNRWLSGAKENDYKKKCMC